SFFQHGVDLLGTGKPRADRVEAELRIDILAHRVVNPGDHPRDLEDLPGDLSGHDIAVVAVGQRGKAVRCLDAGLAKHVLLDPIAEHHLTVEVGPQPVEGAAVDIDHGHLVARLRQGDGSHGAYPAAADDDQFHELRPNSTVSGPAPAAPPRPRVARLPGSWPGWWRRRIGPGWSGSVKLTGRRQQSEHPVRHPAARLPAHG